MLRWPVVRLVVLVAIVAFAGCTSSPQVEASASSTISSPSTTVPPQISESAIPVATTNPATKYPTYGPSTTTTSTTTTTTTAPEPANNVADLRVDPIFDPILAELVAETGVPIRLPIALIDPKATVEEFGEGLGVATLFEAGPDGYAIYLGAPDCNGGNVCRGASFTARRVVEGALDSSAQTGISVPLPGDIEGVFVDAYCGANCGDGYVDWTEDGVRYTVGKKLAPGPSMIRWAWGAIDADADDPSIPKTCGTSPVADGDRFVSQYLLDEINWLVVCSGRGGLAVELIDEVGTLRWADLGSPEKDVVLDRSDGTSRVFLVSGVSPVPLMDSDTAARAIIGDLRCGDVDADGSIDLIDADDGRILSSLTIGSTVENPHRFPECR